MDKQATIEDLYQRTSFDAPIGSLVDSATGRVSLRAAPHAASRTASSLASVEQKLFARLEEDSRTLESATESDVSFILSKSRSLIFLVRLAFVALE